jgi:prevent-host-death family protein
MEVGIRELKAHLSEYIEKACSGEAVVVTERGKPKVSLTPIRDDLQRVAPGLRRLIEEGKTRDPGPPRDLPEPRVSLPEGVTTEDILRDVRGRY